MQGSNQKKRRGSAVPSVGQLLQELKTLRTSHDQLKATVGKLKDILQVQDNWHSRVSKWVGHDVLVWLDTEDDFIGCKLLWTDRYNIGLSIDGEEEIVNKGHVARIRSA
jgi:hypothetical protein